VLVSFRPYLLLALLGLLFFSDLVLHPAQILYADHSDLLAMHLPMKRFLVRSWHETGELPLWNPYSYGGMPFIHDVQVAAFYPPHALLYLLSEERVGAAMSWLVVAHVILAGWLMFGYARYRGLRPAGALVAGIGYMFAGKWLLHVLAGGHYIMIPLAWLPLVLLLLEQAVARRSLLRATWAGAVYALIVLGTHPQMTLYAGVFVALWTFGATLAWSESQADEERGVPGRTGTWRPVLWWLGLGVWTVVVAAALSAVQLLPALEAAPEASRAVGVSARDIAAVCLPSIMGLIGPGWSGTWEDRGGFGVLWLSAALTAPFLLRGRVRYDAAICLALLVFSAGGAALLQWLPGFRLFQIPVRMLMLLALPVALLAGHTTQALLDELPTSDKVGACCRAVLVRVLMVAVLLGVGSAVESFMTWRRQQSSGRAGPAEQNLLYALIGWADSVPSSAWTYWPKIWVVAALGVWLLRKRGALDSLQWKWAWGLLLVVELWALALPNVAVRSESSLFAPSECVAALSAKQREAVGERRRILDRGLLGLPSSSPLGSALPMLGNVQLEPVLGYNSFDIRRYKEYLQFVIDKDDAIAPRSGVFGYPIIDLFPIRNKVFLDLLGTRFVLQPCRSDVKLDSPGEPAWNRAWSLIDWDPQPTAYSFLQGGMQKLPEYSVYENAAAFPRAFLVHQARLLPPRANALEQMKATDLRHEVLLEDCDTHLLQRPSTVDNSDSVKILQYTPNLIKLEARTSAHAYLVLADVWFPGWSCLIDGQPVPIRRADYLFRAVEVSAGAHAVVFRFEPASYRLGQRISAAAIGCLAIFTFGALVVGRLWRQ
jgi:hypothetical protein